MAWRPAVTTGRSCLQPGANPQQSPRQVWLLWSPSWLPDLHRTRQSAPHISSAGRLTSPAPKHSPFVLYTGCVLITSSPFCLYRLLYTIPQVGTFSLLSFPIPFLCLCRHCSVLSKLWLCSHDTTSQSHQKYKKHQNWKCCCKIHVPPWKSLIFWLVLSKI